MKIQLANKLCFVHGGGQERVHTILSYPMFNTFYFKQIQVIQLNPLCERERGRLISINAFTLDQIQVIQLNIHEERERE